MVVGTLQSPIGRIQIVSQEEFITSIQFINRNQKEKGQYSKTIESCIKELKEYFSGRRKEFSIPIKPNGSIFEQEVWNELRRIPHGQTISYEQLAVRLGNPKKIRAAGRANGKNPLAIVIPCHRVIGKDGSLVGYAGGLDRKEFLLHLEGAIGKQVSLFSMQNRDEISK